MPRLFVLALTTAATLTAAAGASAQLPSPISLEASVGMGVGQTGGEYHGSQAGPAADLLVGLRLRPALDGALVAGLSASAQGTGASTDICRPASNGGCVPRFPSFYSVAPLAGWESSGARVRAMIGPAFMQARGEGRATGVQGRLDVATAAVRRVAAVASVRPTLIPDYRGDAIWLLAFGLGLRLR